jgi:hypothetical protein
VSLRIRWQIEQQSGAFPLRNRPLNLLWSDGALDVLPAPPTPQQDGLAISEPTADGKLELKASGAFKFVTGDKSFRTVRLPIGGKVDIACGDLQGFIHADGEKVVVDPLIGKILGGHKLLSRLGAGAVGVVYRALQIDLDREVALKLLNAEATKMPLAVASFRREAQAAGRLSHPNLVQVYNVGKDDGFHYYTMELVPGGDFEDRLKDGGPLPWEEAVTATQNCAAALAFAEENGLVHRDVKPENLMIGGGGMIKLADLGLAATRGMLDKEAAGGTPHFMAPEAVGKGKASHSSDLYSLGCTLYRFLTGSTVFSGGSVKEILLAHRDEDPPTLKEAGLEVPRELDDLLASLLSKDPEDRPEHASDVAEMLEDLLTHQQSSKKVFLLAIPVLALGAWGLFQAFGPDDNANKEPEKIVEYVNVGPGEAAQAELKALEEQSSYFQAIAATEGPLRSEALQSFLKKYPDGEHAEEAKAELERLKELATAKALETAPTAEELARLKALEAASGKVREALDQLRFADAYQLVRLGELAAETEMLTLAALVDQRAQAQFDEWTEMHSSALQEQQWEQAEDIRNQFEQAIRGDSPQPWQLAWEGLAIAAVAAVNDAETAAFLDLRAAFRNQASAPVRDSIRVMELQQAADRWQEAAQNCGHDEMQLKAMEFMPTFVLAAKALTAIHQNVAGGEVSILEVDSGRKAKVLEISSAGIKIEVQISGNRETQVQKWERYQDAKQWYPLLQALAPLGTPEDQLLALYTLIAYDDLAQGFDLLGQDFSAAQAGRLLARIKEWRNQAPASLANSENDTYLLQTSTDLCQALLHEDHYLALNRLESLQSTFSLLSIWASSGHSNWGLQP